MTEYERLCEKKVSSKLIFDGKILHVYNDMAKIPGGDIVSRERIKHIGAVCVVALKDDGNVIMERQFRYPIDSVVYEVPAGKLDDWNEDRLSAAKRELREETGYTADKWTDMGVYYPAAAYCDEKITMYLAEGLHSGEQELDDDEFLDLVEEPLSKLVDDVVDGIITDGKTQVALMKAAKIIERRTKAD